MLDKSQVLMRERLLGMKGERWKRVNVRGINPYTIDRVVGEYVVEFDRRGRSLPFSDQRSVEVRCYDVRCPDGETYRCARLKDAKTFLVYHSQDCLVPSGIAFRVGWSGPPRKAVGA